MRALRLMMTGSTLLMAGCSFTTASGLTECETSSDCETAQVCTAGYCLPQPEGCGEVYGPASAANAIPLGAAVPLSTSDGPDESEVQALNAIKLALDEINQREGVNGRPFVLHICDTRSEPNRAAEQAQWLIRERQVPMVFASSSAQALAVATHTVTNGVLMITYSGTSPDIAAINDKIGTNAGLVWRTAPSDALQGRIIGDLLQGDILVNGAPLYDSVSKVGISYVNDAYGQGLFGVTLGRIDSTQRTVTSAQYSRNGTDITSVVRHITTDQPDVEVLIGFSEDNARIINQTATAGRNTQRWFFTDAGKDRGLFTALGANTGLVDGAYGTSPAQARPDLVYQLFAQRFRSANNQTDPGQYSFTAHAYDAMYLVALGAAYAAGPDVNTPLAITGARMADGLALVTPPEGTSAPAFNLGTDGFAGARAAIRNGTVINVTGASGNLDFNSDGEAPSEYELFRVEAGEFVTVQLIAPPTE
ncbi:MULTISPECIES: ABC transporter substrate-binding protein [Myxococcus]|uniref:ABC transporter substrate-binding protein n=1 Tax=Myxococcus xanthus TaxID=34 RepID=A0AAE6FWW6_MYXXA|nr:MULTISPECIES: ABC transporter substrate-binding protein [Myxococcus]QDE66645.1 ABC transporter substrate-binding protein [Myxococcus xanthus]QDE73918.1 ABC transporter substrate-binding protein [Myxococcus xanthus]QDE81179.1 ABC transporter substrate-binding protein [Myxococcus xanthus]QDE95511.1 ABC transporter substrate-binding protein [Myxococcus xanthus]QDF02805.1 ABC transporter substrate-binding protein [Myxococcus xanthus]